MVQQFLIEKNGWHIEFNKGWPYWVENEPQYNEPCRHCNSTGRITIHDQDCMGLCMCPSRKCTVCDGRGKLQSAPLTPKPDEAIVTNLTERLIKELHNFAEVLNDGSLEKQIAEEKAKNDALTSASL